MQEGTTNSFRDRVATLDEQGKRKWIFAKKPSGKYLKYRYLVSILLLTVFLLSPLISFNGEPLFLFDFINRKFVILSQVFYPQDFILFGLAMLIFFVFIVLFTIIYGRVWCGWACPQTIFMELIFRRIEFWLEGDGARQKKVNNEALSASLAFRKVIKNIIFIALSLVIGNYILMYLVDKEQLFTMIQEGPIENSGTFSAVMVLSFAVFANFSWLREQACTLICPYGRLQGALLDQNSIVVAYDYKRGEPRALYKKHEERKKVGKGHCVDCNSCVAVCPTGIDIRNGTQLECVNCTACIDACNNVMDRFKYPRGLIRYASEKGIENNEKFRFTVRMTLYSFVLLALMALFMAVVFSRNDFSTTILRVPGTLYFNNENGGYKNMYNLRIINNSKNEIPVSFKLLSNKGEVKIIGNELIIKPLEKHTGVITVNIPKEEIISSSQKIKIGIYANDVLIDTKETTFLSP